jgi:hypothetical protein
LTNNTPITVDKRVASAVGNIMSDGEREPKEVLSAKTEDGIN